MNVTMRLAILLMLNVSIVTVTGSISLAEHQSQHSGQRSKQMSNRASDSSNARWLADPRRGWGRGDERRDIVADKPANDSSKRNRGRAKAGTKIKKPFNEDQANTLRVWRRDRDENR